MTEASPGLLSVNQLSFTSPLMPSMATGKKGMFSLQPSELFTSTTVISDEDEFGTLVSSNVKEGYVNEIGYAKVTSRILPFGAHFTKELDKTVVAISQQTNHANVLNYVGVWRCQQDGECWLVSERRNQVSLKALFEAVESTDRESMIAYIAQQILQILDELHNSTGDHGSSSGGISHGYLRPGCIHVCDDGSIYVSDIGIYEVLSEAFRSCRTFPGEKLWPMSKSIKINVGISAASASSTLRIDSDVWDLGITLLCVIDGVHSVGRLWRDGERIPRLADTSTCSSQLNSFITTLFANCNTTSKEGNIQSLLQHDFVKGVSSTACRAAVAEYWNRREERLADSHANDLIARLFRQNAVVVRSPLVNVDDLLTDMFDYEQWKSNDTSCPTVEQSLVRIVNVCKERPLTKDVEDVKCRWRTIGTLETLLDTADLL